MIARLPRDFATNDNYAAGPVAGTPTKVDPASDADGFIPGTIAAPQHVNYQINASNAAARRALELALLRLREVRRDGVTITDTAASLAAMRRTGSSFWVVAKTGQSFGVTEWDLLNDFGAVPASITSLVRAGATDGSILVILGSGSPQAARSLDGGATWIASASGPGNPAASSYMIWNPNNLSATGPAFIVAGGVFGGGGSRVAASATGDVWGGISTGGLAGDVSGLACLSSGVNVIGWELTAPPVFYANTPNVGLFTDTGGTVANAVDFDDAGSVVGNGGASIFHAGRLNAGASLQVSRSADGAAWTTTAEIASLGPAFSSRPRLLMCPDTGLLVLAAPFATDTECALYASLDGVDWVGPAVIANPGMNALGLAGGRLFATFGSQLFVTDGLGTV